MALEEAVRKRLMESEENEIEKEKSGKKVSNTVISISLEDTKYFL
jgi:hypothetical protein